MNLALVMNDERLAGREEGREEGIEIGREEGITQTVQNLLSSGFSIEEISKWTGLSTEKVAELKNK